MLSRKSRSSHRRHSVKEGLQGLQLFPVNIAKFLRTSILKNICKRLFLQISISVTNLLRGGNSWILLPFKPYSILNLCNMFRQGFYVVAFFFSNIFIIKKLFHNTHQVRYYHFFIVEVIVESVNLIQMSKWNRKLLSTWWRTIRFLQKSTYENTGQKEGCSCNFILQVNETKNKKQWILIYLSKTILKRTSNAIFSMKKVDLDES